MRRVGFRILGSGFSGPGATALEQWGRPVGFAVGLDRARPLQGGAGVSPANVGLATASLRRGGPTLQDGRCRARPLQHGRGGRATWAFTIVELIVVITVIVLILAIAVPGMSRMHNEMRMSAAQQTMQGVTTRAYMLALADRAMTAVRFFPGVWDTDPNSPTANTRQHMAVYSYVGTSARETSPGVFAVQLGEHFERAKDLGSVKMPEGVWAAPLEALSPDASTLPGPGGALGADVVLTGQISQFAFNAEQVGGSDGANFLNADDFLLVFDPETGLRVGTPRAYHLRAYVPTYAGGWGYDADNDGAGNLYQRYGFSGVVTYQREPFSLLGTTAFGTTRQDLLQRDGRPYLVHRFSGGLRPGAMPPQ